MTPEPSLENFLPPVPQIGAVLCLDTELAGDFRDGGKHWKLAGSCVLLASDRVLTIGHILGERDQPPPAGRYSAFFPYEGLIEIPGEPPSWEPQWKGDNLALVRLERHVEHCAPLPIRHRNDHKERDHAFACGYGSWPQASLKRLEGIQQKHLVRLGRPTEGEVEWDHYDNLDLSWSASRNGGLKAGRGNSGGPLLKGEPPAVSVAGIIRETGADQQAGSWIGEDRCDWLGNPFQHQPEVPRERRSRLLRIDAETPGETIRFEVPKNARIVKATLNASQGMRLQMGIVSADQSEGLIAHLENDDRASGRFLHRTLDLEAGTEEIAIGVCPVARAPKQAKEVLAQLCVLFL